MEPAAGAFVKGIADSAADIFDSALAALIEPRKNRRERLIGSIQQNAIVHKAANANRVNRFRSAGVQTLDDLFELRYDGPGRQRSRARLLPLNFGEQGGLQSRIE